MVGLTALLVSLLVCGALAGTPFLPDEILNVSQMIARRGYPVEEHSVTKEDGFTLSMQRIPRPGAPVVFLLHGFLDCSSTWVINEPDESLGYILYDNGMDVWLGNNRGNIYSLSGKNFSWNFTFDQMASFDLPAFYSYILQATGKPQLVHVGHSEGTLVPFAGFSQNASLQAQVSLFVALAPVAQLANQKSLMVSALSEVPEKYLSDILGSEGVPPQQLELTRLIIEFLVPGFCQQVPVFCDSFIFAIAGCNAQRECDVSNLNATRVPVYSSHLGGSSMQNLFHFLQLARTPGFCMFDFGAPALNIAHYGQPTPPSYNLTRVSLPLAIFTGGKDAFADPGDVAILLELLPRPPVLHHHEPSYTHLDPIWGLDAHKKIYPTVVQLAKKFAK